jgi:hypothetical protein
MAESLLSVVQKPLIEPEISSMDSFSYSQLMLREVSGRDRRWERRGQLC